jgi:hypothetical protein
MAIAMPSALCTSDTTAVSSCMRFICRATARSQKTSCRKPSPVSRTEGAGEGGGYTFTTSSGGPATTNGERVTLLKQSLENVKREDLGTQNIEGVEATGTRNTVTIPAGQIGNERPIDIVTERWYSKELQTTVMSRRTDPRSGEAIFRLTNINRNEPAGSLFEIPVDYKVTEVGKVNMVRTPQ